MRQEKYLNTIITNAQITRRTERIASGSGKWSSILQEELQFIAEDLSKAGSSRNTILRFWSNNIKCLIN
nr:hypothetical protein [Bacillus infantis]